MAIARVTESILTQQTLRSLQSNLRGIAEENRRISSGRQHAVPSDAPLSVRRLISWDLAIARNQKYQSTIESASTRLGATESALDEMQSLMVRAREIALTQMNASSNDETRQLAAVEVEQLVQEALTLANRKFGDRYLFGGTRVDQPPFERVGDYVAYRGDDTEQLSEIAPGMTFAASISGVRAFGGFSSEIQGQVDLDPILSNETRLDTLNDGRGVPPGSIELRDGAGESAVVDLSSAKTIGDVVSLINAAGFADVVFKADSKGLQLQRANADLSVLEVHGGGTAAALGLALVGMGEVLTGNDVEPRLTPSMSLSSLRGGQGVDDTGFVVRNGTLSATISLSGASTVEDVLNAINSSGTGVVARIAADGASLELLSTLAGADLSLEEAGGTTASELGLLVAADQTPLERLHGGRGVQSVVGADFRLTLGDGTVLEIDVSEADTLADVVALIENHPDNGGLLTVAVQEGPLRIELTDLSGGPDEMSVSVLNGSFAASGLGLGGSSTASVLTGQDLAPGGVRLESAFDGFALLSEGLRNSDTGSLERAIAALDAASTRVLEARGTVGGRMQRLEISERRTALETLEFQEFASLEGDTDLAEAVLQFQRQQLIYQAALQTSAQLLQNSILAFLA